MASSIDGGMDRATALRDAVESTPESVEVSEVVDLLVRAEPQPRNVAFEAYEELLRARPTAVDAAVSHLGTYLTGSSAETRRRGALTAAALVDRHPGPFERLVPTLRSIGNDLAAPGREAAVLALARLALERPAKAIPAVDTLIKMCLDRVTSADPTTGRGLPDVGVHRKGPESHDRERRDEVRIHAVAGLTRIAVADPDSVRESAPAVAELLTDDHHLVRAAACEVFEALGPSNPEAVTPYASDLATLVASDTTQPVPWRAADALVALSETRSDRVGAAVAPVVSALPKFLESRDAERRQVGVALLSTVAEARLEAIEPLTPTLLDLVEADDASVREQVVVVLGRLGVRDVRAVSTVCAETAAGIPIREPADRTPEQRGRSDSDE